MSAEPTAPCNGATLSPEVRDLLDERLEEAEENPEAGVAWEEALARLQASGRPEVLKSPAGLWADLGIDLGAEDIARAREELWVFRANPSKGEPEPE